jgi:hypothetical protein
MTTCKLCGDGEGANRDACPACRAYHARRGPPPSAPTTGDRRNPRNQHEVLGGSRATDPPLTTRDAAEYMGFTTEWIRGAIDEGVRVRSQLVQLEAETITINGRRVHRIHLDHFIAFLQAIGWRRVPRRPHAPSADANRANRANRGRRRLLVRR